MFLSPLHLFVVSFSEAMFSVIWLYYYGMEFQVFHTR